MEYEKGSFCAGYSACNPIRKAHSNCRFMFGIFPYLNQSKGHIEI